MNIKKVNQVLFKGGTIGKGRRGHTEGEYGQCTSIKIEKNQTC
jgi:hypothetical protein